MSEHIQLLDDLGAEFARVAAEAERKATKPLPPLERLLIIGRRARGSVVAVGIAALLVGGTYAVPATRAAVNGLADSFAAWVSGDNENAPGRPLEPGDDLPAWFNEGGDARLIAKTEGVGLYVSRVNSDDGPWLWFGLGQGVGRAAGDTLEGWRQRFGKHEVLVLGVAQFRPRDDLDELGRFPLIGVTSRDVERVELRYAQGPPVIGRSSEGGFVLLVDAWRPPRELVAYDQDGRVLERTEVRDFDGRYLCEKEPGVCPSDASSNGR